jgi:branched-chain amino acid transport system substrate-binding protein
MIVMLAMGHVRSAKAEGLFASWRWLAAVLFLIAVLPACNWREPTAEQQAVWRAEAARSGEGPLRLLLAWKEDLGSSDLFYEGAELAIKQINAGGGLLGRQLEGIRFVDSDTPSQFAAQLKTQLKDPTIFAAIGHPSSQFATIASVIYEQQKVLFIATAATARKLTGRSFEMVFRIIPDNAQLTEQLTSFSQRENWRRIAILNTRDEYGDELANLFSKHVSENPYVQIGFRKSFFAGREDLREIIANLKPLPLDAIFFGGALEDGGRLIRQLAEMGVNLPVLGADSLDSDALVSLSGIEASDGTVVPTVLHPAMPLAVRFSETFLTHYQKTPTTTAAMAYDAVQLLAHGVRTGKSAVPIILAVTLRYMEPWAGVTGRHRFDLTGNIADKPIYFKVLRGGDFYFIPE